MSLSRRHVLQLSAAAATMSIIRSLPAFAADAATKPKVGLQLYSLRTDASKDMQAVLEAVGKIGYAGVEFAGYFGKQPKELRKILDDNNLKACGTHTGYLTVQPNALKATIEFNSIIGNRDLIVPSLPKEASGSEENLKRTADVLSKAAAAAKEQGMRVGYHCHGNDFNKVAGDKTQWDVLYANCSPEVIMQLDIGNCMAGGGDPVAVLKQYPGRVKSIHAKEHGGEKGAVIGEGKMPWKEIFALCETTAGTEWYIVEQESYKAKPIDSVRECFEAMKRMGKV
jgi:sugar phosphate isomerase/epimerase